MKTLKWVQINNNNIPKVSGIYAWYYDHKIGNYDIKSLEEKIGLIASDNDKKICIREFIQKNLLNYYKRENYNVEIKGQLEPKYSGQLTHQIDNANNIVKSIFEDLNVLKSIQQVFNSFDFNFSSPLYVGMAKDLSSRINTHRNLIAKYNDINIDRITLDNKSEQNEIEDEDIDDHNFAARIIERKFIIQNLVVVIKEVTDTDSIYKIIENLMNRINYPILGRN